MSKRYATEGSHNTVNQTALTVIGSATIKAEIYYLQVSCTGTPADAQHTIEVKHFTADGTGGSAVTPVPIEGGDIVARATSNKAYASSEPTYAGVAMLKFGLNQRSIFQFYAQEGGELVTQAAVGDGIGIVATAFSTGTPTVQCVMHFKE